MVIITDPVFNFEGIILLSAYGKHNWHIMDLKNGTAASAALYSIAETAKANNLKPYEYFLYLLEQLMHYPRSNVPENKLAELMPWSKKLPDRCRKLKIQ